MFNIICWIEIAVLLNNVIYISREKVKGNIIKDYGHTAIVDFSKEANRLDLYGNYDKIMVTKDSCDEVK